MKCISYRTFHSKLQKKMKTLFFPQILSIILTSMILLTLSPVFADNTNLEPLNDVFTIKNSNYNNTNLEPLNDVFTIKNSNYNNNFGINYFKEPYSNTIKNQNSAKNSKKYILKQNTKNFDTPSILGINNKWIINKGIGTKILPFYSKRAINNEITISSISLQSTGSSNILRNVGIDLNKFIFNNRIKIEISLLSGLLAISLITLLIYFIWSVILLVLPLKRVKKDNKGIEKYRLYVMVPSLNEKYVVENTIHRFFGHNNNNPRLFESHLVVIDDGSDDGTGEILENISSSYDNLHIISRIPPNARQGKGEALNEGLRYIKGLNVSDARKVVVGVIDADAHINDYDYNKIISVFNKDDDLAMVQTSVGMNTLNGWLHRMQDIEFQSCICLISNIRNYLGNAAGGGNGQFFRLSSIENKSSVWGNSLLEDFELSTRILLEGKKTYFLENAIVYQEPVGTIKTFIVQRTRWAQGGIECIPKYGKKIIQSPNIRKLAKFEMFFYMLLPFITSIGVIGHLVSIVYTTFIFTTMPSAISLDLILLIIISFMISFIFGIIYGIRTEYSVIKGFLLGFTIPIYGMLMIPVCYRAIIRYFIGERKWEKTEHIIENKI